MNRACKGALLGRGAQEEVRRAAFVRLILHNEANLARSARRLCDGDDDRAQDLVQETLLRAYQACLNGRLQAGANHLAWLLRILTNLFINDYHHRRRWEAPVGLDAPPVHRRMNEAAQEAALLQAPAALLLAGALDEHLERALATLPEKLRLCVALVDLEGLDYAQAAGSLGIPLGTVRSRLSRARLLLKSLLWDYARERRQIPPAPTLD